MRSVSMGQVEAAARDAGEELGRRPSRLEIRYRRLARAAERRGRQCREAILRRWLEWLHSRRK